VTGAEYKLLFDGTSATKEQLERFETITVEQFSDKPWQARLEVAVCLDDQGNWSGDDEPFMQVLHRVRVEVKLGDGTFQPLIDGPVVGFDSDRRSAPGQSLVTVVVNDDSVLLNRDATPSTYPAGSKDSDIARRIFGDYREIAEQKVTDTPDSPDKLPPEPKKRSTDMQLLRKLARRNNYVCGVVPGARPTSSVGVFAKTPVFDDKPPELVLLGRDRNIEAFDVKLNARDQRNVVASTLSFSNKQVVTRSSQVRDKGIAGEDRLRPGSGETVDLQNAVDSEAQKSTRAFEATGTVRQGCYSGVLLPFHPVVVKLGTTTSSGTYAIDSVTHKLGRSEYTQSFTLTAEELSESAAGPSLIPAGLF
jgi:phage protein D